jgi:hypothetical protein
MTALSPQQAKERVILAVGAGSTVADALRSADRSQKWYENARSSDPEFKHAIDTARANATKAKAVSKDPTLYQISFAEWRKRFLNRETYPHMQNLVDVLEGRDPSWIHPAMTYEPSSKHRSVINIPPFHAKSQTITVDWVTYKLCLNPNVRVIIVSKKQEFAKKFLYQIKQRLESPLFADLQLAYGGPTGFKGEVWSNNQIYLAGRDSDEKDPNVEAVGMGGQIYGSRADIIILDDCIVKSNAGQFESQIEWIQAEVETRVKGGTIALVGTRLNTQDLYSEIIQGRRYMSGKSPWTYLAMPMVLEFAEDPQDWVTLWPKSHQPMESDIDEVPDADGLYEAWPGTEAAKKRSDNPPRTWELVFQQRSVSAESVFHPTCVWGSVDRRRKPGPLSAGGWGHPADGGEGKVRIVTIDPAGTGEAFMLHGSVDRLTRKRWINNAWMGNQTTIRWYMDRLEEIFPVYGIDEIVIEQNGYANWLIHDEAFMRFCQERGIRVMPHFTGSNKQDPDLGVAGMSSLFGQLQRRGDGEGANGQFDFVKESNLIQLPDPDYSPGIKAMIEQLLVWEPGKSGAKLRMDGPMALWFFELRARIHTLGGDKPPVSHVDSRFTSQRARRHRTVVPLGF